MYIYIYDIHVYIYIHILYVICMIYVYTCIHMQDVRELLVSDFVWQLVKLFFGYTYYRPWGTDDPTIQEESGILVAFKKDRDVSRSLGYHKLSDEL